MAAAKAEIQKDLDAATAKADAEIAVKAAESEKTIAEIRDGAHGRSGRSGRATPPGNWWRRWVARRMPKAVTAAVSARLKG